MQKKAPSPKKEVPTKRKTRSVPEEVFKEKVEPQKRRKFPSGKGLEQEPVEVVVEKSDSDSEEQLEDKTLATKKQDESPSNS